MNKTKGQKLYVVQVNVSPSALKASSEDVKRMTRGTYVDADLRTAVDTGVEFIRKHAHGPLADSLCKEIGKSNILEKGLAGVACSPNHGLYLESDDPTGKYAGFVEITISGAEGA